MYLGAGRYDESVNILKKALKIQLRTLGNDHQDVGRTRLRIGTIYSRKGMLKEALDSVREADRIYCKFGISSDESRYAAALVQKLMQQLAVGSEF
jgi:tetratricopeptide (TPR) repeat protein